MEEPVRFFGEKDEWSCFSNFSKHPVTINGKTYPTTEHWFQAAKFEGPSSSAVDKEYADMIRKAKTPNIAKILAGQKPGGGYAWRTALNEPIRESLSKGVRLRDDWEEIKDCVMLYGVLHKVLQHSDVRKKLLSTGTRDIIEASPYDYYWGEGRDGSGKNMLGHTLMNIRLFLNDLDYFLKDKSLKSLFRSNYRK